MSKFEFLAVFVSIIFGLSLTHVLSGATRSIYRKTFELNSQAEHRPDEPPVPQATGTHARMT